MIWLTLAIIGYILNAFVTIVDKFFLSSKVKDPWIYAFYACGLSVLAFALWPFDFSFLSPRLTLIALFSGITFFIGIFFFYAAMAKGEASRVASMIGAITPIVIFILSYFFHHERLSFPTMSAFCSLILGSIFLSLNNKGSESSLNNFSLQLEKHFPFLSLISALFLGLSFFSTKAVFFETSFINGFVWIRVGTLLAILPILAISFLRKSVFASLKDISFKFSFYFIFNKVLSAIAFLVLNYAIMLGSVTLVSALEGVEYAFIFILAFVFSLYKPDFLSESFSLFSTFQKVVGISLVSLGIALLFLS